MMPATAVHPHPCLRVVICDRRQFDRAALRALCSHDANLHVVGDTPHTAELPELLAGHGRAVLLIGRSTVREEGAALLGRVRAGHPGVRIVLVGVSGEAAAEAGADGFLARDGELADQLAAVNG
ncbi:MAG TPA: hypothetical protein VGC71_05560 [Gaiellales bacterium]|jgi:two-component system response regulator DesR